jgi:hypothetical protein
MVKANTSFPNESWPTDFMSDALYDGQKIKRFAEGGVKWMRHEMAWLFNE